MNLTRLRSLAGRLAALALLSGSLLAAGMPLATAAAPFEDTMAQRTLACTACHGPQGRAAADGYYPRLAGKPAGYLYNQLLNFREGRRHYGLMTRLIDPLSNAYLLEIAQYFANLDVPYPAPPATKVPEAVLRLGQQLVMQGDASRQLPACVQCHGRAMTGVVPDVPGLLGLPRDYLSAQLGAWKAGQRRAHLPDCMNAIVARLSLNDINAVASWVAAQPLPVNTRPAAAPPVGVAGTEAVACGSGLAAPGRAESKAQQ